MAYGGSSRRRGGGRRRVHRKLATLDSSIKNNALLYTDWRPQNRYRQDSNLQPLAVYSMTNRKPTRYHCATTPLHGPFLLKTHHVWPCVCEGMGFPPPAAPQLPTHYRVRQCSKLPPYSSLAVINYFSSSHRLLADSCVAR